MSRPAHSRHVPIVSGRRSLVDALKAALERSELRGVRIGASLEEALQDVRPDLVVVDANGGIDEAIACCASIRDLAPEVAILLV
ncbi:MAG: hypothetical protein ACQGVC_24560, partial [Myxococcota bacterium]